METIQSLIRIVDIVVNHEPVMHNPHNTEVSSIRTSRRELLKGSAAAIAGFQAWQAIPIAARSAEQKDARKPRFEFVQINDTHVQRPLVRDEGASATYARANDKLTWCVNAINVDPLPAFVLGIGDLVHGASLEALEPDFQQFQKLIKPLKPPFHPTPGNHDVVQQEGNLDHERAYRNLFGQDRVNYIHEHDGLLFVMLNNSGATVVSEEIIAARNSWLRKILEENPNKEKIVCCHIPVVPVRDKTVLASSFGFTSYCAHDEELKDIIDEHSVSILAVLSGHLHLTGFVKRNDVYHISICGTASYPSDYARFSVFDDCLEMTVHQLPKELASTEPSIHGKQRHGRGFTDSSHSSIADYEIGRCDERRLSIPRKHSV